MHWRKIINFCLAGGIAGAINGLFGAGGGMVLVPTLAHCTDLKEKQVFPCSVSIILPICIISLFTNDGISGLPLQKAWPYLTGSILGGLLSGWFGHYIPTKYLHRVLGILILWGGIRCLC